MRYFYAANRLQIPYCNFTPEPHERAGARHPCQRDGQPVRRHGRQDRPDAPEDGARGDVPRAAAAHRRVVLHELPRQRRRHCPRRALVEQDQGPQQGRGARLNRRLPRRQPPGSHPLLQAPGRLEGSVGQHRHRGLRRRADADQGQLPLPGLGPGRAARHRPRAPARRRETSRRARDPATALALLQVALRCARRGPGARPLQAGEALARLGARARDGEGLARTNGVKAHVEPAS